MLGIPLLLILEGCSSPSSSPPTLHQAQIALNARDYQRGVKMLKALAGQGDPEAQSMLGGLYHKGQGVSPDIQEALNWYRRSAAKGNFQALRSLGDVYKNGDGVERDTVEAYRWYLMAARRGDDSARVEMLWLQTEMSSDQVAEAERRAGEAPR